MYNGRILLADRDFKIVSDTFHTEEGKTLLSSLAVACLKGEETSNYDARSKVLEIAVPVQSPDVQQLQGVMLVSVSAVDIAETLAEMEQRGVMLIGSIVVLSVFLAWLLSTILVKPLARVTKAIEDLTDGMLDEEISVPDYTETELITDAFNKMVNRMKILDESRQEFVSNVSHELKTPLTSMKVLADSLVGQQGVPEELYQEFMSDITAEIDRENKIITDLLSLVKMDKKAADVNITHMDINQLLEDILKRLRPIADRRNIDLILDCFRPVDADVDEVKFTLAVSNLVENGIKYNVDDGWVRVSLDADHKYFYITVADSGMGIPEDSIERIFERFYRVDKSHSKEIGGTGLGLAITKVLLQCTMERLKYSVKRRGNYIFCAYSSVLYTVIGGAIVKKKLSIIITALILSILMAGCSVEVHEDPGKQDAKYYLYDISPDETQLQKESYSPEETTADYMLKDMMQRMNSQQTDSQNRISLLPEGVQMNYSIEEDVLVVNFNSQYSSMSRARELLVRAGVVKTFLQVPGINSVRFTIENEDLTDSRDRLWEI